MVCPILYRVSRILLKLLVVLDFATIHRISIPAYALVIVDVNIVALVPSTLVIYFLGPHAVVNMVPQFGSISAPPSHAEPQDCFKP